ncbi:MAG TPA: RDD family protein [Longimicrobiaceae bacterium]
MYYASRGSRLLGQFIDGVVTVTPILFVALLQGLGLGFAPLYLVAALSSVAYYFLADGLPGGQSLGKRVLGMTVVDAGTGEPCTMGQSFVRNLLLAVLGFFDWVFIFGSQHQRLGDKLAGTVVLEAGRSVAFHG